jgi:hypothetical protein
MKMKKLFFVIAAMPLAMGVSAQCPLVGEFTLVGDSLTSAFVVEDQELRLKEDMTYDLEMNFTGNDGEVTASVITGKYTVKKNKVRLKGVKFSTGEKVYGSLYIFDADACTLTQKRSKLKYKRES